MKPREKNLFFIDDALLHALSQGSESALEQIIRKFGMRIYNTAEKFLQPGLLAEQMVSDVFLEVWQARETFTDSKHFNSFMISSCRKFICIHLKKMAVDSLATEFSQQKKPGDPASKTPDKDIQ